LVLGRRPLGAILHSSNEPGELSQWLCHDDSTINIVLVIIIIIVTRMTLSDLAKYSMTRSARALSATAELLVSRLLLLLILQMSWIRVLSSHSCGGTLQNLHLKLLHSSTQTAYSQTDRDWQ